MAYYYLNLGHPDACIVQVLLTTSTPFVIDGTVLNAYLEIPESNASLLGYRYLGTPVSGVTVLGADYLSLFEAPPAPGCYWDGAEWVCPVDAAAE